MGDVAESAGKRGLDHGPPNADTSAEAEVFAFNQIYARYFPADGPARIFLHVPSWPGPFDIEIDCIAVI
jgi:enamine deaminase RidA (YjgF/YER057c/UK114 family)